MWALFLVGLGGIGGAVGRYLVGRLIDRSDIPLATFVVNVTGSVALGAILAAPVPEWVVLVLGVGFCGAFTTFSAFSYHTVGLWNDRSPSAAALHAFGTLAVTLVGFWIGAAAAVVVS